MEVYDMDLSLILLTVFGSLLAIFLFYYLIKVNKKYFIPSLLFFIFGLLLIFLSQNVNTGGGFLDVIYMLFGILSIVTGTIVGLIVLAIRTSKSNRK